MKTRDMIMAFGALIGFGLTLSTIVWKLLNFRPPSVAVRAVAPADQSWLMALQANLKPFFTWFNDYALIIILVVVMGMALLDFVQTFRQQEKQ